MGRVSLKQLEAFIAVVDLGGFSRAAEKLGTTQPSISSRISGLEARLGITLMERDAGSIRLTPMGVALLAKARRVIRAVDDFVVAAEDDAIFDGVLRLGVTEMVVHSWLGAYLAALKNRFPNIDVDLTVDLSANLSDALFTRSLDLALQSGPFNRQTSGVLDLGSFPLIWVAAPDLGVAKRALSLGDLAAHPILTHARGTLPFEQLNAHVADAHGGKMRLVPSTNMAACIQLTTEGLGVACLPAVMVQQEIAAGRLVVLDYPWCPDALCFSARYDAETSPHFVREAARLAERISCQSQQKA
ncbi:MAG: LysR family transcriptional regulator [Pseudomonadota bacterium]